MGQERRRSRDHEGSRGLRRIPRAVRHQLESRRRGLPRRELFSRGRRRHAAIRPVGARAGRRHRVPAPGGISALHLVLVRAAGQGCRHADAVRAAGLAEHRGRAALADLARRHADHERRRRPLSAQADRAARHRAAHQHVLLRQERSARRQRLAARDPRFGRAVDVDRRRRMDLAAAGQPAATARQFLFRRQSARLRPAAAGPQLRSLPGRRRLLRPAAEPVGRAQGPDQAAAGARAPCSWSKFPPSTRPSTTSWRSGIRRRSPSRARSCCSATGSTGARKMPYGSPLGADHRDAHRHRRHGRRQAPVLFLAFRGRFRRRRARRARQGRRRSKPSSPPRAARPST